MTWKRFLRALSGTRNTQKWYVTSWGSIRTCTGHCPISLVANDRAVYGSPEAGARRLGLAPGRAANIADAADFRNRKATTRRGRLTNQMRRDMFAALHLPRAEL